MGEYIKYNGIECKVGTCENIYYSTYPQFLKAYKKCRFTDCGDGGATTFLSAKNGFRFRFPFESEKDVNIFEFSSHETEPFIFAVPKSTGIEIAHGKKFVRSGIKPYEIGTEHECIYSDSFPTDVKRFDWNNSLSLVIFNVVQQKLVLIEDKRRKGLNTLQLQTVVKCPECGELCRLSEAEAISLYKWTKKNGTEEQKQVATTIIKGYFYSAEHYPNEMELTGYLGLK